MKKLFIFVIVLVLWMILGNLISNIETRTNYEYKIIDDGFGPEVEKIEIEH